MPVRHIVELFALEGEAFVTEAYRSLFGREPDVHGMAYYLGRMAQGHGKAGVIAQLAKSRECRSYDEVEGLKALLRNEFRKSRWYWSIFKHRDRREMASQSAIVSLERIERQLGALHSAALAQVQQTTYLVQQRAQEMSAVPVTSISGTAEKTWLAKDTVSQLFMRVLGREPESEDAITHHARFRSRVELHDALIRSDEFQSRIKALPEYARNILRRQLRIQLAQYGD